MGFRLQQNLLTLSDLERQFTAVVSVMRIMVKQLRLASRGFRYKAAIYLSYLHIDDEIGREL